MKVIRDFRDSGWVREAREILVAGGVVGFPTETVYGLAACGTSSKGIDSLNRLKKRSADKPYTLHISGKEKLGEYIPNYSWPVWVLARKGWPGPITIVSELTKEQVSLCREKFSLDYDHLYYQNSIGLRCPDHPVAKQLLEGCDFPIVAPSANPADMAPAANGTMVQDYYADRLDLLLDAGEVNYQEPSTVVKISERKMEILREGAVSRPIVESMMKFAILFVCTGNTCRSPMAEVLFRKILSDRIGCRMEDLEILGITISSAGTFAGDNLPASRGAVWAMEKMGLDLSRHRSQSLTRRMLNDADMIYAMSEEHKDFMCNLVPEACNRIELMVETGVSDPIGGSDEEYLGCAEYIKTMLDTHIRKLFR